MIIIVYIDTTTFPANVVSGDRNVEVRPHECNPTATLKKLMNKHSDFDLIVYIGEAPNIDFSEDHRVFTCSIGQRNQKYYLNDGDAAITFLDKLSKVPNQ